MTVEVKMPQMGESIAEGTLVKWHKTPGEKVARDEPLFEISTDKVDTEVPSPADGYLAQVLVKEGETVPVHTVVCVLSEAAVAGGKTGDGRERASGGAAAQARAAESRPGSAAAGTPAAVPVPSRSARLSPPTAADRLREKSSPLVRRLAQEHGIDLSQVEGSGTSGRVTKEDLLRHITRRQAAASHGAVPTATPEDRLEPMSVMRARIAEHMIASRRTSAHVSTIFEVDMTAIEARRASLLGKFEAEHGVKLTYLPFIIEAVAAKLQRFPLLNASVEGNNVRFHGKVNIGVAVALDDGLIVPVIRDADAKDLLELARAVVDLAGRARSKKLHPDEVQGGTFTITNPGVFGSLIGTPIIHQPQVGILCVGAIKRRPVVLPETDAIAIRSMAYLSLSFDHRLIDGAVADRFMAEVVAALENRPARLPAVKPATDTTT